MIRLFRLAAIVLVLVVPRAAAAQAPAGEYAWASACKDCHAAEYASWQKTKHSNAIIRLSGSEKQGDCVGCHMTGTPPAAEKNVNVQCEACHGAGSAHIAAAQSGAAKPGAITRKPGESTCTRCHSEKSPHFKFFSYAAMVGLVHTK